MSYFSGTFPKKFCGSDDQGPSNKHKPLHNDFWNVNVVKTLKISHMEFQNFCLTLLNNKIIFASQLAFAEVQKIHGGVVLPFYEFS